MFFCRGKIKPKHQHTLHERDASFKLRIAYLGIIKRLTHAVQSIVSLVVVIVSAMLMRSLLLLQLLLLLLLHSAPFPLAARAQRFLEIIFFRVRVVRSMITGESDG